MSVAVVGLLLFCLVCAVVPAVLFCINLTGYVAPPEWRGGALPAVTILIPARNEAGAIGAAVSNALATRGVAFEVVVMDDGSTDGTDAIVRALAAGDARVRLEQAPPLPAGWNGKQHACWALANAARNPVLCFVDADVTLGPYVAARMVQMLEDSGSALVSGFPRQVTGTTLEWLLLPLIHFVLLGFLPISRMRAGTDAAFAAGCGQFMMVRRDAYFVCGGHSRIRRTMHDGLLLPRLLRAAGYRTDLADITGLASCRMYTSAAQVWSGLAKNATEGIAAPARIVPVSVVLLLGQVLPFVMLPCYLLLCVLRHHLFLVGVWDSVFLGGWMFAGSLWLAAAWLPRWLAVDRFRQDWRSALLHPVGMVLLLVIQWYALLRKLLGGTVSWRGREYVADPLSHPE